MGSPIEVTYNTLFEKVKEVNKSTAMKSPKWKDSKLNILIPMAGLGDRFKQSGYTTIKPLISIFNKPMIQWAVESLGIDGNFIFVVNTKNELHMELIHILKTLKPECTIIETDYLTEGPASSCLLAKSYVDNEEPLLITNCDQIMTWEINKFKEYVETFDGDGFVVTYDSNTTKNSYIRVDDSGVGVELAEKKVISSLSLNGIHFWKKGKDFVYSAEKMIKMNKRVNDEFYIAPTYNELIAIGKIIRNYSIDKNHHWPVGTPEDLNTFVENYKLLEV